MTGVAYYTVQPDGYEVVATVAASEGGTPMRFVATLAAGQKVVLSVPREPGLGALSLEIVRSGDQIVVTSPPVRAAMR